MAQNLSFADWLRQTRTVGGPGLSTTANGDVQFGGQPFSEGNNYTAIVPTADQLGAATAGKTHQQVFDEYMKQYPGNDYVNYKYNPATDSIYDPFTEKADVSGNLIMAALMAGVGGLGAAGAGIGAGAAGAGGAEAAAGLTGSGLGVAGETGTFAGLGGAAGAGAGSVADEIASLTGSGGAGGAGVDAGSSVATGSGAGTVASNYVGDLPTTADVGGTSIYGANPSIADLISQYQLSGQNPLDFLKTLTGSPVTNTASTVAQSALSKIINGSANSDDWLKLLGQVAPGLIGAYGASQQSNTLKDLADKYLGFGAPYRDQLAALMKDPSSFYSSPEATGAFDAMARKLSIGGNPAGDPYKQATLTGGLYSLLQGKENQLAGFGGLTALTGAAPGAINAAATAPINVYNSLGTSFGNAFNPPSNDLQSILKLVGKGYSGLG